jgi:16S rRNA (cytidine1402-2'-O)-methyltransferase
MTISANTLYIVSTPIGNLGDITFRAVEVLKSADQIWAEDTRHSRVLFKHYNISAPCRSYNDFNKERRTPGYVKYLESGHSAALICDAGTPGIADAAFYLVRAVRRAGLPVVAVPGPSACIAGLVVSGLPTDRFFFANFPPKKSAQRIRQLELFRDNLRSLDKASPSLVYYIGPAQLVKFLTEISQVFGPQTRIVLARELTKKYEEVLDKSVHAHLDFYSGNRPRGEYTLLFHPLDKG